MEPSLTIEYTTDGTTEERLIAIREAGFTAVNQATPHCRHLLCSGKTAIQELNNLIGAAGLQVDRLHAPYRLPILYEPQTEWYHLSLGAMKSCIRIAAALGAGSLIVHPMNKQFPEEIDRSPALDQLVQSFGVLVETATSYGINIAVENIDEPYSQNILATLFTQLDDLKFCFDTGHAELWRSWDAYLPVYLPRLVALHVHDNHGSRDEHLVPGDGTINFQPFIELLKTSGYPGYFCLECAQIVSNYMGDRNELAQKIWQRANGLLTATN